MPVELPGTYVTPSGQDITGRSLTISATSPYTQSALSILLASSGAAVVEGDVWAAEPNGVDDTTALAGAYAAAVLANARLRLWAGNYIYNGTGFSGTDFNIRGQGAVGVLASHQGGTTITLGASSYFLVWSTALNSLDIDGFKVVGGLGCAHGTFTGSNVVGKFTVGQNMVFRDYTLCAVGHNASDMPYWDIGGIFYGANSTTCIGVALSGNTDQCRVRAQFLRNAIHVKADRGGTNLQLVDASFIQEGGGTGRAAVWLVPQPTNTNPGQGLFIRGTKFGSENLDATDYRILIADGLGGGDFSTDLYNVGADSTGFVYGGTIEACDFLGSSGNGPLIYSTTPNVRGLRLSGVIKGSVPSYLIQYRTVPLAPSRINLRNYFGPFQWDNAAEQLTIVVSNSNSPGFLIDPDGILQDNPQAVPLGDSDYGEYARLAPSAISAFTLGSASVVAATDAIGGADAVEATATSAGGFLLNNLTTGNVVAGRPVWIEFDLKQGSSLPMLTVKVEMGYTTGGNNQFWQRFLNVPTTWRRFRYLAFINNTATAARLVFTTTGWVTGTATKIQIGRVHVYHSREPVPYSLKAMLGPIVASADIRRSRQTPTEAVLVSGVNATAGEIVSVTLSAARVVGAPLNPFLGQRLVFQLIQNGTGGWAVTWNAIFLGLTWADTGNTANKRSSIEFEYDGTNWNQCSAQAPYAT